MAVSFSHPSDDTMVIQIGGEWNFEMEPPQLGDMERALQPGLKRILFETRELKGWDSSLLTFLIKVTDLCSGRNIELVREGLPQGVQRLLNLASPEHQRKGVSRPVTRKSFLVQVADATFDFIRSSKEILSFVGEAFLAFMKFLRGKANFRRSDFFVVVQDTGPSPFPLFR